MVEENWVDEMMTEHREPDERDYLIKQVGNSVEIDGVTMFAYVVMSNHYHLLLRTDGEFLSKVMHRINTRYSRYFNYDY